ncbi:VTT domain-containing protein [Actinoplanes sp. NPDC051513]|uniref:VTT domain-containing protein n=1 Tax=Actinoplanes sp. NPDC051513 TaxID=3363908 RepID=UPI0037B4A033
MLNDLLGSLPPILVYAVVGVLVAAESAIIAGLVLPAATALIALGLLANAGTVPIVPALVVGVAAGILGGTAAFHSGRRRGPRLRTGKLGRRVGKKQWDRAERLFARHGGRAVFLGQWIVGARTLIPRLAAVNGVPYRRFALWHTPAAALWALWMVGASYLAGASYDLLVARAGRAGGAVAVLAALVVALVLLGRWLGRHPRPFYSLATTFARRRWPARLRLGHKPERLGPRLGLGRGQLGRWLGRGRDAGPAVELGLGAGLLFGLAALLVLVVPVVVRFSGLADADAAITNWARSQWTSDGYLFALDTATFGDPALLFGVAAVVSLGRWLFRRWLGEREGLITAVGPVLPIVVLAAAFALTTPPAWESWREPSSVVFPASSEFGGYIPFDLAGPMATMAAGHTAQLAGAVGLLAWMLTGRLPWKWRVTVWTAAAIYVVVFAGSWVYLGWSRTSETVAAVLIGAAWAALTAAIWSGPRAAVRQAEFVENSSSVPAAR